MVAFYGYNYDPYVTVKSTESTCDSSIPITISARNCSYSTTYTELPPDEAELEKVAVPQPWLWLLPWDPGEPCVRLAIERPPGRPVRCRDPPS